MMAITPDKALEAKANISVSFADTLSDDSAEEESLQPEGEGLDQEALPTGETPPASDSESPESGDEGDDVSDEENEAGDESLVGRETEQETPAEESEDSNDGSLDGGVEDEPGLDNLEDETSTAEDLSGTEEGASNDQEEPTLNEEENGNELPESEGEVDEAENLESSLEVSESEGLDGLTEEMLPVEQLSNYDLLIQYSKGDKKEKVKTIKEKLEKKEKIIEFAVKHSYKKNDLDYVSIETSLELQDVINELSSCEEIELVGVNSIVEVADAEPSAPIIEEGFNTELEQTSSAMIEVSFNENQWYLENQGQEINGEVGEMDVDINYASVNQLENLGQILVGVLDTGIDVNHDELSESIYVNQNEIAGNDLDDDGNGYIDDINGWDFFNDDSSIYDNNSLDEHGTSIAGLIGSSGKSIQGVASNAMIIPLKALEGTSGRLSDVIEAIEYAEDIGVQIMNCSWVTEDNPILFEFIRASDMIFVTAAGNNGIDIDVEKKYPASYDLPNVISVASVDNSGDVPSYSNYGFSVDLVAPGSDIYSIKPDNGYDYFNGTSFSTALVSGVASVYYGLNPDSDPYALSDNLKEKYREIESLSDTEMNRLIDMGKLAINTDDLESYIQGKYGDTGIDFNRIVEISEYALDQLVNTQSAEDIDFFDKIDYNKYAGFENGLSVDSTVNEASGSLNLTSPVLELDGIAGLDLDISLVYNSGEAEVFDTNFDTQNLKYEVFYYRNAYITYSKPVYDEELGIFVVDGPKVSVGVVDTDTHSKTTREDAVDDFDSNHGSWVYVGSNEDEDTNDFYPYICLQYVSPGIYYNYEDCTNSNSVSSYLNKSYQLGPGWGLSLSSLEISADAEHKYLHLSTGANYQVEDSMTTGENNLVGYELDDIKFNEDSATVSNGEKSSAYVLEYMSGIKKYFADDGRLIAKVDKWGNQIIFYHETIESVPVITKIVDSVGREIDFSYTTSTGEKQLDITIIDPIGVDKTVSLISEESVSQPGTYVLTEMIDSVGRETNFNYSMDSGDYNYFDKTSDLIQDNANVFANITSVTYPSGLVNNYSYDMVTGNLGSNGYKEYFRVVTSQSADGSDIYTPMTYTYTGERSGYPDYGYENELPEDFEYSVSSINGDGLVADKEFNKNGLLKNSRISLGGEAHSFRELTYNSNKLVTENKLTEYNSNGTDELVTYRNFEYDSYGNLIFSWSPLANGNTELSRYRIKKVYDPRYNLITRTRYLQDVDTIVRIDSTLSADGKSIISTNTYVNDVLKARTDYVTDIFGNIVSKKQFLDDINYTESVIAYADLNPDHTQKLDNVYKSSVTVKGVEDADGNPVTDYLGASSGELTETQVFDWNGNIIKSTNRNGNDVLYEYDLSGRLTKVTDGVIIKRTWAYNDALNQVTITDVNGNQYTSTYNGLYELESIYDHTIGQTVQSNIYDDLGRISSEDKRVGSEGVITEYDFDGLGNLIEQTQKDAQDVLLSQVFREVEYGVGNWCTRIITTIKGDGTSPDQIRYKFINKMGNTIFDKTTRDGYWRDNVYHYNYINQRIRTWLNIPPGTSDSLPPDYQYTYDGVGNVIETMDVNGNMELFGYNMMGWMTEQYDYTACANNESASLINTYDALGRVIKQERPFDEVNGVLYNQVIKKYYNGTGNVIEEAVSSNKSGEPESFNIKEYEYDDQDNLTIVIGHVDDVSNIYTQFYYDDAGLLQRTYTGLTDPLTINGLDQVVVGSDSDYSVMSCQYDSKGNRINRISNEGTQTIMIYDDLGRMKKQTKPDGSYITYDYDGLSRIDAQNAYDSEGNLEKTYTYSYSLGGQVSSASGEGETITYQYDELGRVSEKTIDGVIEYSYRYDDDSNLTDIEIDKSGVNVYDQSFIYDEYNRLDKAYENDVMIADYDYDLDSRATSISYSNGSTQSYIYNDIGALISVMGTNASGQNTSNSYEYYLDSKVASNNSSIEGPKNYSYDGLGRLLSEDSSGQMISYDYDDFSNRASQQMGSILTTYQYDGDNRLLADITTDGLEKKVTNYTYDPNGNQISKMMRIENTGGAEGFDSLLLVDLTSNLEFSFYQYDVYNRLVSGVNNQGEFEYTYNLDGLRKSKETVDGVVNYYYNDDNLVLEMINDQYVSNRYSYGNGLVTRYDGLQSTEEFYQFNGQGDIIQLVGSDGTVNQEYAYDPFGNEIGEDSLDNNPFRYRSYYYDKETGSQYLSARYYNPKIGRFISEDSYEGTPDNPLSLNLYTYCQNNPVMYRDQNGHFPVLVYLYISALGSSPDTYLDMQCLAESWASGNPIAIAADTVALLIPAVPSGGIGKAASKISNMIPDGVGEAIVKNADEFIEGTSETVSKLTGNKKIYYNTTGKIPTGEVHHTLPQQFADEFAEVGLDVNSGDFLFDLPKDVHRLKPNGLHTTTNPLGQTWNASWKDFFMKNPDFSKTDVLNQWQNMIDTTGIGKFK
jgi:RHS repeat-associated protein